MENNKLLMIQEMLMESMKRLSENQSDEELKTEVARSNALSNNASSIIKTINIGLSIIGISERQGKTIKSINKELGIANDEE